MPPSPSLSSSSPFSNNKLKKALAFSLRCGCNDSKSVSVSSLSPATVAASDRPTAPIPLRRLIEPPESSFSGTPTFTSTSTSSSQLDTHIDADDDRPSFSGLLSQLGELEQSVKAWDSLRHVNPPPEDHTDALFPGRYEVDDHDRRTSHARRKSDGNGAWRKAGESVAVVKDSADPVGDFRRSMLQMIVENEIVDDEELRELLARFLALNAPCHHGLIVRAFSGIWTDVFTSGY